MFNHHVGLKHRIRKAETVAEITKLLKEGESYQYASAKTRRQWTKIAKIRQYHIENDDEKKK